MKPLRFRAWLDDGWFFGWGYDNNKLYATANPCDGDLSIAYVEPETLCEYTGFITRQGTPVYTNDIVKMGNKIAVVKKCKGSETQGNGMGGFYEYRLVNKNGLMLTRLNMPYIEVIGDVFSNPELLPVIEEETAK